MANKLIWRNGVTGGTANDLDGISYSTIADGTSAIVLYNGSVIHYTYDSTSSLAEVYPKVIKPDDNLGNGRWLMQESHITDNSSVNIVKALLISASGFSFTITGPAVEGSDPPVPSSSTNDQINWLINTCGVPAQNVLWNPNGEELDLTTFTAVGLESTVSTGLGILSRHALVGSGLESTTEFGTAGIIKTGDGFVLLSQESISNIGLVTITQTGGTLSAVGLISAADLGIASIHEYQDNRFAGTPLESSTEFGLAVLNQTGGTFALIPVGESSTEMGIGTLIQSGGQFTGNSLESSVDLGAAGITLVNGVFSANGLESSVNFGISSLTDTTPATATTLSFESPTYKPDANNLYDEAGNLWTDVQAEGNLLHWSQGGYDGTTHALRIIMDNYVNDGTTVTQTTLDLVDGTIDFYWRKVNTSTITSLLLKIDGVTKWDATSEFNSAAAGVWNHKVINGLGTGQKEVSFEAVIGNDNYNFIDLDYFRY